MFLSLHQAQSKLWTQGRFPLERGWLLCQGFSSRALSSSRPAQLSWQESLVPLRPENGVFHSAGPTPCALTLSLTAVIFRRERWSYYWQPPFETVTNQKKEGPHWPGDKEDLLPSLCVRSKDSSFLASDSNCSSQKQFLAMVCISQSDSRSGPSGGVFR